MLAPTPPQRHEIPRTWLAGRWELAREVLPPQDTTLLAPYVVQASDSVAYVFDGADARVKAIDRAGNLVWAFGKRGQGPGEFAVVTDLRLDATGRVWVADAGNARVTVLTPNGRLERMIPTQPRLHRIVPIADTAFLAYDTGDPFLVRYNLSGNRTALRALAGFDAKQRLVAEPALARAATGNVIVGFRWASRLVKVSPGDSLLWDVQGIDQLDFPAFSTYKTKIAGQDALVQRVDPAARAATAGLAEGRNGQVLAWSIGTGVDRGRIIDHFSTRNGQYLGSTRLPIKPLNIAHTGTQLVLLLDDPVPSLQFLKWNPSPAPGRSSKN
jgi:hypothetical protein